MNLAAPPRTKNKASFAWFLVISTSFAAFLGPFTQTVYAPLLPELENRFQTTPLMINLSISLFTLVMALSQLFYGPLVDRRGRKPVLLAGLAMYTLGSAACATSRNIDSLLLFRAIQALGIAAGSVVATTVIADLFEGARRAKAMGFFQMLVALGPVLGPVCGGFLAPRGGSVLIFSFLAILGLVSLIENGVFLKETLPPSRAVRASGLSGWKEIFKNPLGKAVLGLGLIQYYSFYTFLVFIPGMLTKTYHLPIQQKGLAFLPMSLMIVVSSLAGGQLQARFSGARLLVVTSALNAISVLIFAFVWSSSLGALIFATALFGLFLGLSLPVQTTLLSTEFVTNRATAIGVYNFLRFGGMAAGPLVGTFFLESYGFSSAFIFAGMIFCLVSFLAYRSLRGGKKMQKLTSS